MIFMEKLINQKTEEELKDRVESLYMELTKRPEIKEALDLLDQLPENLIYHNKNHTIDVMKETILFALADGASQDIIELSAIAAAWHDVGYIRQYEHNEPVAVELFRQSEAFNNLSESDREEIISIILDTQMVMSDNQPHLLQKMSRFAYVLDGDVSNFGRSDYFDKRLSVAKELDIDLNDLNMKRGFFEFAIKLLENHSWKTESARRFRQSQKDINLKMMKDELVKLQQ
jgi:hypothetical protein